MVAGDAWERHRRGEEDARKFGFGRWKGTTFVRASVLRDLAALNKRELLAWDYPWGEHKPQGEELLYLDRIAELTLADNSRFEELRAACEDDPEVYEPLERFLAYLDKPPAAAPATVGAEGDRNSCSFDLAHHRSTMLPMRRGPGAAVRPGKPSGAAWKNAR